MIRRLLTILLPLLVLAGCQERELPTALAPEGAAFASFPVGCNADPAARVAALIAAIDAANANAGADVIELAPGCTYTLTSVNSTGDFGSNGLPIIRDDLTINANGATVERSTADGTDAFRIFEIASGTPVSMSDLTITRGRAEFGGAGGIYNQGTLTLTNSTVSGNSVTFGTFGGGIYNEGTLTLTHSTVSGNRAFAGSGGGIANFGTLTLTHSTVSGNQAAGAGGGIYNEGTLTLTHSTVSGNTAGEFGGGIYSFRFSDLSTASTTILNSTISGNTAGGSGGGVLNNSGLTRIVHSTLTGNRAPSGGGVFSWNNRRARTDVKGSLIWGNTLPDETTPNDVAAEETVTRYHSQGYNLIGAAGANVDFSLEFDQPGDQTGVGAGSWLGPLALNAPGTTMTHALLAGSPAIDAGTCADHTGATITTDQRGVSRPQPSGGTCDIGAFELEQASAPVFGGFLPPVRAGQLNVVKAGRGVPIKFSLGGDFGLNIFAADYPTSVQFDCPAPSVARNPVSGTTTARESRLSYDASADQYNYLWVTPKGWAGTCRQFQMQLSDGNTHTLDFSFTR